MGESRQKAPLPARRPSPANYDFLDSLMAPPRPSDLPSLDDLYGMYAIYNQQYFEGKLPGVKISYSKRMLAAGAYYPTRREIKISEHYHRLFPDEVYDTLKHEMIHVVHFTHTAAFKAVARRIGASIRANEHPSLRRPPRFIYVCPVCFTEYPRVRRLRMASCGRCSRKGFDERFKLVLKRRLKGAVGQ